MTDHVAAAQVHEGDVIDVAKDALDVGEPAASQVPPQPSSPRYAPRFTPVSTTSPAPAATAPRTWPSTSSTEREVSGPRAFHTMQ